LAWDLGDTYGTVAVRMPLHPVALEILAHTGPLAVSAASRVGSGPALTAHEAREQLGYAVTTYLEAGPCLDPVPSTIVDCSGEVPSVLRAGAISLDRLREVVPDIRPLQETQPQLPDMPAPSGVEP
jgi:L-threonylcarbamoyladenylate synthase